MDFSESNAHENLFDNRGKRSGGWGVTVSELLYIFYAFGNLVILAIVIFNGSLMWMSCLFKNTFIDKASKSRKIVKIGIVLFLALSILFFFNGKILMNKVNRTVHAPACLYNNEATYKATYKIKNCSDLIEELQSQKVNLQKMRVMNGFGVGLFYTGCVCFVIGILAPLVLGCASKLKYGECTPVIPDDAEKESLKGKGELVSFYPCCSEKSPCSTQIYPHNVCAAKWAQGHVWVLVIVSTVNVVWLIINSITQ